MDSKKFLLGGIIGSIVNFFLGWLVWGMLLGKIMRDYSTHTPGVFRSPETMIWWALVVGNIGFGFLIAYVLSKANISTAASGAVTGAVVGLLVVIGIDFIMYAQMKVFGLKVIAIDAASSLVVNAIVGAVVGWFLGRGSKTS